MECILKAANTKQQKNLLIRSVFLEKTVNSALFEIVLKRFSIFLIIRQISITNVFHMILMILIKLFLTTHAEFSPRSVHLTAKNTESIYESHHHPYSMKYSSVIKKYSYMRIYITPMRLL